jgi:hypothetical protein
MPTISPITKSPTARYLIENNAIAKRDSRGCSFVTREGLYLGRLSCSTVENYKLFTLDIFAEGFKVLFRKTVAIGQNFAYIKNGKAPLGVSLLPVKTYKREVNVDFLNKTSKIKDTETSLDNKLDLIAVDENTGVGLYDTEEPFKYSNRVMTDSQEELKHSQYSFTLN